MWVPHACEGVHVSLESVFAASLVGALQLAFIAPVQSFLDGFVIGIVEALGQDRILDSFNPQVVQGFPVGGPVGVGPVQQDAFVGTEVELVDAVVDQVESELKALYDPLLNQVVDIKTRLQ